MTDSEKTVKDARRVLRVLEASLAQTVESIVRLESELGLGDLPPDVVAQTEYVLTLMRKNRDGYERNIADARDRLAQCVTADAIVGASQ